LFDYISIVVEDPIISVAKDSINRFNLPHVCACPKQGSGFITPFSELEVKETTDTVSSASYLDFYLQIDDSVSAQLSTKI
jgi:hypothetical protein